MNGTLFLQPMEKNLRDGVGGTPPKTTKKSLQSTSENQILNSKDMFDFCTQNFKGIQHFYVESEVIIQHETELQERFKACLKVPGT